MAAHWLVDDEEEAELVGAAPQAADAAALVAVLVDLVSRLPEETGAAATARLLPFAARRSSPSAYTAMPTAGNEDKEDVCVAAHAAGAYALTPLAPVSPSPLVSSLPCATPPTPSLTQPGVGRTPLGNAALPAGMRWRLVATSSGSAAFRNECLRHCMGVMRVTGS